MDIATYRGEFSVYIVDADYAAAESVITLVKKAGYDSRYFPTLDSAKAAITELPPHIVVFNQEVFPDATDQFLAHVREVSSEILVVLLIGAKQILTALQLIEKELAYDFQVRPYVSSLDLVQRLDRAAERLFFQFESEQLRETLGTSAPSPSSAAPAVAGEVEKAIEKEVVVGIDPIGLNRFLEVMSNSKDLDQTIQGFLDATSAQIHNSPALYFKYVPHYMSLVLSHAAWLPIERIRGIGIELRKMDPAKLHEGFHQPGELAPVKALLQEAFKINRFHAFTHYNDVDVLGVAVFFDPLLEPDRALAVQAFRGIFELTYRRNLLLKEKHALETNDPVSGLYTRKFFSGKLDEEISRSRRISMALSLIVIDIDHFQEMNKQIGFSNADTILRMLGVLLKKSTRVSDIIARLGVDEIAILLPHTDHMGAAVKAERIRRAIEATRFAPLEGRSIDHVTVSVGVSEYPAFCNDAEGLLKTADEALFQVKQAGGNRVCLATPSPGFVADFKARPAVDVGGGPR